MVGARSFGNSLPDFSGISREVFMHNDAHTHVPALFLFVAFMLLAARFGALAERWKQPAVLGELLVGVLLGALFLSPGFSWSETIRTDPFIGHLAEFGVILLLFKAGLESNIAQMRAVGVRALLVAVVGVLLPFVGGWAASAALFSEAPRILHVFVGATFTATSVGITARVFTDLAFSHAKEAKIVLGAAVIDDVLGLIVLAVVAGMAQNAGAVDPWVVGKISLLAVGFLVGAIVAGTLVAKPIGFLLSRIHNGVGMKMAFALFFCFAFAYGATLAGLAPIVGAFAAGLILDDVHFDRFRRPEISVKLHAWADALHGTTHTHAADEMKEEAAHVEKKDVEHLIEGISSFFVPLFFVYTGMQVDVRIFLNPSVLGIALLLTLIACLGKVAAGWVAGRGTNPLIVGVGMIPRGEVGLIFAGMGKQLGVVDERVFATLLIVIMATTLVTPPLLGVLVRRKLAQDAT